MAAAIREGVDVGRHAGESVPTQPIPKPQLGGSFKVDAAVIEAFPVTGSSLVFARSYGMSLWGETAQLTAELPDGNKEVYFLKVGSPAQNTLAWIVVDISQ